MFLNRIFRPVNSKELFLSYRKTMWGVLLLEVGLVLLYLEWVALRNDTQFLYSGDHHWSNSVNLAGCQLRRFNVLVIEDLTGWLTTLDPETPTYDYVRGQLDRQTWNFTVATAGVTHLGGELTGLIEDLSFWEDPPWWELSDLTRFRLLRWIILGGVFLFLLYLFYLKCWTPPGSLVSAQNVHLLKLLKTYQKVLLLLALGEWFFLVEVYDSLFGVFQRYLFRGDLPGGVPLGEEIISRLNKAESFVREDIDGFLGLVAPDTFDYEYLSGHLDRQVWNFKVATAGVTHLGGELAEFPPQVTNVIVTSMLARLLRRGALVGFIGLGLYLWFRR